jgi:hypothetical protein
VDREAEGSAVPGKYGSSGDPQLTIESGITAGGLDSWKEDFHAWAMKEALEHALVLPTA